MGALHAGHARLIEQARGECDDVVVSIFVNPLQFDRQDDLGAYPRTLDSDLALCESTRRRRGVRAGDRGDVSRAAALHRGRRGSSAIICAAAYRPGHFRGVATVVMKLLQIVQPDGAYFGEKDAQQLAIIRRMVARLRRAGDASSACRRCAKPTAWR